jgi:hypothetical protein
MSGGFLIRDGCVGMDVFAHPSGGAATLFTAEHDS